MFTRGTTYKMKPESVDEAVQKLKAMMPTIMGMNGMLSFTNAVNDDGSGVVVSVVESEAISNANQEQVAAIWAEFAEYLEAPPEANGYNVVAHENN